MNLNFCKHLFGQKKPRLSAFGQTDTGKKRQRNEDSFSLMPSHKFFIVADGMGGHKAGDVASESAVESLAQFCLDNKLHSLSNQEAIRHTMIAGFIEANQTIMTRASKDEKLTGMGCTMIACFVNGTNIHLCHVGDVRAYKIHAETIEQLTNDHTYAAQWKKGENKDSTPATIPKNVLNRAIGFPFKEDPEYNSTAIGSGTRILLCSDGLWGMITDQDIHNLVTKAQTPEEACSACVDAANQAGGKDNITVVTLFWD